jgi:hypothetical protein
MKEKFILSVDWDYFFPDLLPYDWGHQESPIYYDFIWHSRAASHNLLTKERAIDVVKPDPKLLDRFWERVCPKAPKKLIVVESHAQIEQFITEESTIYNFDQHHDIQYTSLDSLDCGNWAGRAMRDNRLKKYVLVYPPWREKTPEGEPGERFLGEGWRESRQFPQFKETQILFDVPADLPKFDTVFLCRSYAWTPTWSDDAWLEFAMRYLCKSKCYSSNPAFKARHPNMKEAIAEAEEWEKHLSSLRNIEK